jgi:uncharacterized protein (DUF1697 family)
MAKGTYIALLRGINVGGKNILPMKDLVAIFTLAGCSDVRHYIQSGNVIFGAGAALATRIPAILAEGIEARFGFGVPVVVRSAREVADVVRGNPYLESGADVDTLHVAFLSTPPSKKAVGELDAARSPPDSFVARGREIYLCCPNGMGRTKLTNAYFDAKLATTSTMRNWRTVLKLLEMTGEARTKP